MIIKFSVKGVILSLRPYTNIKFVLEAENGQELIRESSSVAESSLM